MVELGLELADIAHEPLHRRLQLLIFASRDAGLELCAHVADQENASVRLALRVPDVEREPELRDEVRVGDSTEPGVTSHVERRELHVAVDREAGLVPSGRRPGASCRVAALEHDAVEGYRARVKEIPRLSIGALTACAVEESAHEVSLRVQYVEANPSAFTAHVIVDDRRNRPPDRVGRVEEMSAGCRDVGVDLTQRLNVVQDPERPAVR